MFNSWRKTYEKMLKMGIDYFAKQAVSTQSIEELKVSCDYENMDDDQKANFEAAIQQIKTSVIE